jgi:hypothetical protein
MTKPIPVIIVLALILGIALGFVLLVRGIKTSAKSRSMASNFGWALLFIGSGRPPPPPPQTQIEEEAVTKKNRENEGHL